MIDDLENMPPEEAAGVYVRLAWREYLHQHQPLISNDYDCLYYLRDSFLENLRRGKQGLLEHLQRLWGDLEDEAGIVERFTESVDNFAAFLQANPNLLPLDT